MSNLDQRCCVICRKVSDEAALLTVSSQGIERVTACPEHLRQAIALTDIKPLSDAEWREMAQGLLNGLADIKEVQS